MKSSKCLKEHRLAENIDQYNQKNTKERVETSKTIVWREISKLGIADYIWGGKKVMRHGGMKTR